MGRGKGEPTDQESDRVIDRFGYGIQKRNVLCSDWFYVVHKSGKKKREKREKKREREKQECEDKAGKAEQDPIQKKGEFFDLPLHQRPVALGWMVNIEGSIGYFIYDVIGRGNGPCEEKGHQGLPDKR